MTPWFPCSGGPTPRPSCTPVPRYHLPEGESRRQPGHSTLPGEEVSPTAAECKGSASVIGQHVHMCLRLMFRKARAGARLPVFVACPHLLHPAMWLGLSLRLRRSCGIVIRQGLVLNAITPEKGSCNSVLQSYIPVASRDPKLGEDFPGAYRKSGEKRNGLWWPCLRVVCRLH